ncbi:MAG TPA: cation:proton antiporter subunit C [Bacteroidales bacterium]|nr:cation:proton antiporter subunit C [Bacteroidales bacterium]HRX10380.1 cation:proton antiporter subunit C [Draconibacterium sp.]
MSLTIDKIALILGMALMLTGLWGGFTQKNLLKIILSFSIFDTGLNILIVALGYLPGRTAPIIEGEVVTQENLALVAIDPVPQALVLTAIVIGFGITALMLVFALKMNQDKKTLDINQFNDLKW